MLHSVIRGSKTRITSDAYLSIPYGEFTRGVRLYMVKFNTAVYYTWKGHTETTSRTV